MSIHARMTSLISKPVTESADPADMAAEMLDKGMDHPVLSKIRDAYDKLVSELAAGKKDLAGLRKSGAGDTEAVALAKKSVAALKALATTASKISDVASSKMG